MIKIKREKHVDLEEYANELCTGSTLKQTRSSHKEFDYKSWAHQTTTYPEVDIIDEKQVARTTLPALTRRCRIGGQGLELYNNADLTKVPKAVWNIKVCTGYFDYGLRLPLSSFVVMVLNHFETSLSQHTAHVFLVLSILENINDTVAFGPLSMDEIKS